MRNDFNGNYLAHYGTKGMKWGVRRYQNPDGSLTPAGREHYGYSSNQSGDAKEVATAVKKKAKASYNTAVNKSAKKKNTKAMKEARSKNVDEMSTQELRDYNNRLQEEQRFRNLTESDQTKARRWVKNIAKESAKVVLSAALVILGKKFLGIGSNKDGNLKDTANNLKNKALTTATNAKNSAQNFVTDFKSAYNEETQRQAHEQAVRMHQQAHDTAVRTHQQIVEQNQRDQDMINQQNQMIFQQQAMMPMMFGGKKKPMKSGSAKYEVNDAKKALKDAKKQYDKSFNDYYKKSRQAYSFSKEKRQANKDRLNKVYDDIQNVEQKKRELRDTKLSYKYDKAKAKNALKDANKQYDKSFNDYYHKSHQAWSLSKKKREANSERLERALNDAQVVRDKKKELKAITSDKVSRIRAMASQGKTQEEIAAALHISVSSVNKYAR